MTWRALRAAWRLLCVVLFALAGAAICAGVFPFIGSVRRMRIVGAWSRAMLAAFGITLRASGTAQPGPVLLAANHISWLDILAIDAVHPARFVSKADIRHWPLLGWMVACGGTLFIERERKRDAMRVVHQVAAALTAGEVLAVFPEGTTADGHALLPFHANLLQAAVATHAPVQGVALRYSDAHAPISAAVEFVGETTLAESVKRVLWADALSVSVQLLPPQPGQGTDRRALAEQLRAQIAQALAVR